MTFSTLGKSQIKTFSYSFQMLRGKFTHRVKQLGVYGNQRLPPLTSVRASNKQGKVCSIHNGDRYIPFIIVTMDSGKSNCEPLFHGDAV